MADPVCEYKMLSGTFGTYADYFFGRSVMLRMQSNAATSKVELFWSRTIGRRRRREESLKVPLAELGGGGSSGSGGTL